MSRGYKKTYRKMKSVYKNVEMERKPFPKPLLIIIICAAAFVAAFFAVRQGIKAYNDSKVPSLVEEIAMLNANDTEPEIFMKSGDGRIFNRLTGNKGEDFEKNERGESLVPLPDDREQRIVISLPRDEIKAVSYQIRAYGSGDLTEETQVEELVQTEAGTEAFLQIKDLLNEKRPYNLQIRLEKQDGTVSLYNTTVEVMGDVWADEKLAYVEKLTGLIYDSSKSDEVYEEFFPLSATDGSNYAVAGYNSLSSQIMWEGLSAKIIETPVPSIVRVDEDSTKITQSYPIELTSMQGDVSRVIVNEVFCVRMTANDEVVLTDYNREAFETLESPKVTDAQVNLGFQANDKVSVVSSEESGYTAFVNGGNLWLLKNGYNGEKSKFTRVFCIDAQDGKKFDKSKEITVSEEGKITDINGDYGINVLSLNDSGDIVFSVYGTYPGGFRTGETGISTFTYSGATEELSEVLFVPLSGEFEDIEKISGESFLNDNGEFFTVKDGSLFRISQDSWFTDEITDAGKDDIYSVGEDASVYALQQRNKIITYDCKNNNMQEIQAESGKVISLIGHVDSDMVYGLSNEGEDYLSAIKVVDREGNEKISYENDGVYYSDVSVYDMGVRYKEFAKQEDGSFKQVKEGRIIAKEEEESKPFYIGFETETGKRKQLKINFDEHVNTDDEDPVIINECKIKTGRVVSIAGE